MTYTNYIQNILDTRGRFSCGDKYHEKHHIVPKCVGGTNDKDNLIDLYAEEHYIAHKLLALENPDVDGLQIAWFNMCQCKKSTRTYIISEEDFAEARKRNAQRMKKWSSELWKSEEHRQHIRECSSYQLSSMWNDDSFRESVTQQINERWKDEEWKYDWLRKHIESHNTEEYIKKQSDVQKQKYIDNPNYRKDHWKAIYCPELNESFESVLFAEQKYNISSSHIVQCCKGKRKSAGKHPVTGEKLTWNYVENNC